MNSTTKKSKVSESYKELKLARGLVFRDGHVLLAKSLKDDPQHFFLPGGKIEELESAPTALAREFLEELGWKIRTSHFVGCLENQWQYKKKKTGNVVDVLEVNFMFTIVYDSPLQSSDPKSLEEKISFHWIKLTELSQISLFPTALKTLLPKIHQQHKSGSFTPVWATNLA